MTSHDDVSTKNSKYQKYLELSEKSLDSNTDIYQEYARDFLNHVSQILGNKISGDSLMKYISNSIRSLNLYNLESYDVFLEAVIRGLDYISNKHRSINNPAAWLRVAASNILMEESRNIKRLYQLSDDQLERFDCTCDENKEVFGENPAKALQAFHSLSKSEKRIIIYKLFQGRSYCEINTLPSYKHCSESAIRKQYSRAIEKLRLAFHQLSN